MKNRTTYGFKSNFASRLAAFIEEKRSLGYDYESGESRLRNFDEFCHRNYPDEYRLTKDIVLDWSTRKPTEHNNAFNCRMSYIKEFARYLLRNGEPAYVLPPKLAKRDPQRTPYVFTIDELRKIFAYADSLAANESSCSYITYCSFAMMQKLMYSSGLRPCEARKISVDDISLTKGIIQIKESKGHKDRNVVLADDMLKLLREYDAKIATIMPSRDPFLPNVHGNYFNKHLMDDCFCVVRNGVKLHKHQAMAEPTLYSFRHSFCTHRLYLWIKEGHNLMAKLPYLSAYMGHATYSSTFQYTHFLPELYQNIVGQQFPGADKLVPDEVNYE